MSRIMGLFICAVAAGAAVAFFWGLSLRSYWAIAVPVAMVTLALLGLVFWIGWTLLAGEMAAIPPSPPRKEDSP